MYEKNSDIDRNFDGRYSGRRTAEECGSDQRGAREAF